MQNDSRARFMMNRAPSEYGKHFHNRQDRPTPYGQGQMGTGMGAPPGSPGGGRGPTARGWGRGGTTGRGRGSAAPAAGGRWSPGGWNVGGGGQEGGGGGGGGGAGESIQAFRERRKQEAANFVIPPPATQRKCRCGIVLPHPPIYPLGFGGVSPLCLSCQTRAATVRIERHSSLIAQDIQRKNAERVKQEQMERNKRLLALPPVPPILSGPAPDVEEEEVSKELWKELNPLCSSRRKGEFQWDAQEVVSRYWDGARKDQVRVVKKYQWTKVGIRMWCVGPKCQGSKYQKWIIPCSADEPDSVAASASDSEGAEESAADPSIPPPLHQSVLMDLLDMNSDQQTWKKCPPVRACFSCGPDIPGSGAEPDVQYQWKTGRWIPQSRSFSCRQCHSAFRIDFEVFERLSPRWKLLLQYCPKPTCCPPFKGYEFEKNATLPGIWCPKRYRLPVGHPVAPHLAAAATAKKSKHAVYTFAPAGPSSTIFLLQELARAPPPCICAKCLGRIPCADLTSNTGSSSGGGGGSAVVAGAATLAGKLSSSSSSNSIPPGNRLYSKSEILPLPLTSLKCKNLARYAWTGVGQPMKFYCPQHFASKTQQWTTTLDGLFSISDVPQELVVIILSYLVQAVAWVESSADATPIAADGEGGMMVSSSSSASVSFFSQMKQMMASQKDRNRKIVFTWCSTLDQLSEFVDQESAPRSR